MAVQHTLFLGKYKIRFNYTGIVNLSKELGLGTIDELGSFFTSGNLTSESMEKTILLGLKKEHPDITMDDLKKEGGLFDQFMDADENNGFGGLMDVAVQALIDSGVLARANSSQVADTGEVSQKQ